MKKPSITVHPDHAKSTTLALNSLNISEKINACVTPGLRLELIQT